MKTYVAKENELKRRWYVIDAEGEVLGRMATRIATILCGKNKPSYTPNVDTGDFVVVVNAEKVVVTGQKAQKKIYQTFSGYPSGRKEIKYADMLAKHPDRVVRLAVQGMIPKSRLGRQIIKKLKIYAGPDHPHKAQQPESLSMA
jgi:large subunit ribosomal protein L13